MDEIKTEETKTEETKTEETIIEELKIEETKQEDVKTGDIKPEKKKGKVLPVILVILLLIIAGIGAFVALNFSVVKNSFRKLTMSSDDYCKAVLKDRGDKQVKAVGDAYDRFITNGILSNEFNSESTITFTMTDDAFDLIEDAVDERGGEFDADQFSFLSTIGGTYTVSKKDALTSVYINVFDGDGVLLDGQIIFDKDEQMVYIGFPDETDEFMAYSLSDFYDEDEIDELFEVIDKIEEVKDATPSRQQIEKLYSKLLDSIIDTVENVEEDNTTIEVGDLSAKCTVLTINVDEKMIKSMAEAMCDFLTDEELTDIIDSYAEVLGDDEDYAEEYEDAIAEMEDTIDDFEMPEDTEIKLSFYVDNKGNIIGTKFDYEEDDNKVEAFSGYIISGKKIACEFTCESDYTDEEYKIVGNGSVNGSTATIDFEAEFGDVEFEFSLSDVEYTKISKGLFIGKFEIALDQFEDEVPEELENWVITLDINSETDTYAISVLDDDTLLATLECNVNNENKSDLDIPDDVCEVEDDEDIMDYMDDCEFERLADFIDALGMGSSEQYVNMAKGYAAYIKEIPIDAYAFTESLAPNQNFMISSAITFTGVAAPQLIKYVSKSKVSADTQLADTIRTAITTVIYDPDVVDSDCYDDMISELEDGVNIVEWGEPDNEFTEAVADILGVSDFEELEKWIKSKYTGDGIFVIYSDGSIYVEFQNTDASGGSNTSGDNNISVGYYY